MSYSTLTQLKDYIPAATIQMLTDDNNELNDIDIEKVTYCQAQADDLIDSYLRGRYPAPITGPVPVMISELSVKLTAFYLYKRSLLLTLPEAMKDDYQYCMSILRDIQRGRISPFEIKDNPTWFKSNHAAGEVTLVNQTTNNWQDYLVRPIPGTARPGTAY